LAWGEASCNGEWNSLGLSKAALPGLPRGLLVDPSSLWASADPFSVIWSPALLWTWEDDSTAETSSVNISSPQSEGESVAGGAPFSAPLEISFAIENPGRTNYIKDKHSLLDILMQNIL